jgi:hypothetical protein
MDGWIPSRARPTISPAVGSPLSRPPTARSNSRARSCWSRPRLARSAQIWVRALVTGLVIPASQVRIAPTSASGHAGQCRCATLSAAGVAASKAAKIPAARADQIPSFPRIFPSCQETYSCCWMVRCKDTGGRWRGMCGRRGCALCSGDLGVVMGGEVRRPALAAAAFVAWTARDLCGTGW